ncbi:ATP-binding protein [Actinomadura rubrisoli]|uniref:ATP-binding protein n=1 Tax=Actinomadura rubrisoli TaxID=2530368 RepID=A0A4R5A0M6_9ACTN|nr:ATP-binding protein [Actinomadura rubrisoli]TDD65313.1 ATP-binding protein [Actinomadura rubrisoli]
MDGSLDLDSARALAAGLQRLLRAAGNRITLDNAESPLIARIAGHVGVPFHDLVMVGQEYKIWENAGLQRGIDAYLAARTPGAEWFGVAGAERHHDNLSTLLAEALMQGTYSLGRPEYGTAAVGPQETMEVVQLGLVATAAPDGSPVVVGVLTRESYEALCVLNVFARDRATAAAVRDELDRLRLEHEVMRGQVLTFSGSEYQQNALVAFLPRPHLAASDVVLPDGRLEAIEAHVVGIAEHAEQLLAAGQHLKRGLLLHGPPGTGKTHTVRYLMGRLLGYTIIQLTGPAMKFLDDAVALARSLQPAVVIVEDVDLVAEDRDLVESSAGPLLFTLLDAMDGVAGDADVVFVLTTNRVESLERALSERPGRIDLAVEIPRPDAEGRIDLLRLYARELRLAADLDAVAARTEGVTASFIKELVRRAVLVALRAGDSPDPLDALTDAHFGTALTEMFDPAQSLTRGLLGAAPKPGEDDDREDAVPGAGVYVADAFPNGEFEGEDG